MKSPWQVLGLKMPCSRDDVRRAYARLLRQHRPDVDPVGFRRVRDAYEHVLRVVERAAAADQVDREALDDDLFFLPKHDAVSAAEPAAEPAAWLQESAPRRESRPARPPARPRALAAPLQRALARARANDRQQVEARLHAILVRALRTRRDEIDLAELALAELELPESGLRLRLQPSDIDVGAPPGTELLCALLLAHVAADDWAALSDAVRSIEEAAARGELAWLAAAAAAVRIVALLDPAKAGRLADVAFRRAPQHVRDTLGETEKWIHAGKQLSGRSSSNDRKYLVLALCRPEVAVDDPLGRGALAVAREHDENRVLLKLLSRRFPTVAEELERRADLGEKRAARRRQGRKEAPKVRWTVVRAIFLVLLISGGLRNCRREPVEPTWYTPNSYTPNSQSRRLDEASRRSESQRLDEVLKRLESQKLDEAVDTSQSQRFDAALKRLRELPQWRKVTKVPQEATDKPPRERR